jgi:hypothetical protein
MTERDDPGQVDAAAVAELLEVVDQLDADNAALRDKIVILTRLAEDAVTDQVLSERELGAISRQLDDCQAAIANSRTLRATAPVRRIAGRAKALIGQARGSR